MPLIISNNIPLGVCSGPVDHLGQREEIHQLLGLKEGSFYQALLGLNDGLNSFDQACVNVSNQKSSLLEAPSSGPSKVKIRKRKQVGELGKHVRFPASYYACNGSRKEKCEVSLKKRGSMEMINEVSEDSISNGESYFISSIADYEIVRCNSRFVKKSEMGKRLWGSIEALGVVSGRDAILNENLLDVMECRDRDGLEVLKEKVRV